MDWHDTGTYTVLARSEAAMRGLSRFYTGRPCREGHWAERYVSNKQCVACNAVKARNRERHRSCVEPSFRMYRNTLRRTGMALRGRASPVMAVGCDHPTLREHISKRFRKGMTWDRYRQWEVDHIIPLSSAREIKQLVDLCHYTNLQPFGEAKTEQRVGLDAPLFFLLASVS